MSKKDKKEDSYGEAIFDYLTRSGRPYSVNDLFNNLQKEVGFGKAAVTKAVDNLVLDNRIKEKVYGKQKIYFIDQTTVTTVSDEELKKMDEEITKLNELLLGLNTSLKPKESQLAGCKKSMSLQEIVRQTKELEKENQEMETRLAQIKEKMNNIDPKENDKVKKERTMLVKEWRKRKRMANSVLDAILDSCDKPKKALLEEIGVETDEDAGVKIPVD